MDAATLRSVPLFASLDSKSTAELGEYLTIHDYPKSATIFRNGDPGDAMYLIDVGKVRISITDADGAAVTLAELSSGDFFGEMAMLDGQGRSANATAMEDARLAKLTRDDFLTFMQSDSRVTLELLTALTQRLRRTDELLRHRVSRNVNQEQEARLTMADRAADKLAEFGGSWKFITAFMSFLTFWVIVNGWVIFNRVWDPYPFLLLSTALNMLAAFVGSFIIALSVGRFLKRRASVQLGLLYQLFCLALAFYVALAVYGVQAPWRIHFAAAVILLSTALIVALVNRYIWDVYFER